MCFCFGLGFCYCFCFDWALYYCLCFSIRIVCVGIVIVVGLVVVVFWEFWASYGFSCFGSVCAASALPTITRCKYKINHYKRLPFVAVVVSLVPLRSVSTTITITTQIQQKTLAMLSLHLFLIFCFCGLGEMIILLLLLLLLYSL